MVRRIEIAGPRVGVTVALTVAGCPLRNEIQSRVDGALLALDGVEAVDLEFGVMTDDERAALRTKLHGDPGRPPAASRPTATPRATPSRSPTRAASTRVLLIASGKGGVGKSSVTTNLASRWPPGQGRGGSRRRRVGVLDPAHARRAAPRPS